ncbi:MAG TPA: NADH-quinone oxidoreductase subunit H [Sedimentisphaerales bacterium]|jgi:formate hydrogenlyase subunit 4|nr:NADH-quinone oxidoreductase subunit H [Sedimentisphaerales bacterium]HNU29637.1 NADH-quinone oxidoreductase subunit H [Sedimentisphaerales bacterium]
MKTLHWIGPVMAWVLSPLMLGIINRVKAVFAGRRGQPLCQLYYDLFKLLRKGSVYSRSTSLVIRVAPSVVLACMMICTMLVPWGKMEAPVAFAGDIILLAYLLGLARFATVLAALDTGSAFEGMGASREVEFAALAEPSFFLGMLVLVLHCGSIGLSDVMAGFSSPTWQTSGILLGLVACSWFILLLTENSRIPIDDPNTHLELTMIHEVMVLDYSGPDFAYILYGASLKLWVFAALVVNLIVPLRSVPVWGQIPLFLLGMGVIAVLVGIVESILARLRLQQVPKILIGAAALSIIALTVELME